MSKKYLKTIFLILICLLATSFVLILTKGHFIVFNNNLDRLIATNEIIRETTEVSIEGKTIVAVVTEPKGQLPIAEHYIYFFESQSFGQKRLLLKKTINVFIHRLKLIELKDIDADLQDEFLVHIFSGKYYETIYIFDYTENKMISIQFNRDGKIRDFVSAPAADKIFFQDIDKQTKGLEVSTFTEATLLVQDDPPYYEITSVHEFYHLIDHQYVKYDSKEEKKLRFDHL